MLKIITIVSSLVVGALTKSPDAASQQFNKVETGKQTEVVLIPDGTNQIKCFAEGTEIASSEVTLIKNGKLLIEAGGRKDVRVEVHFTTLDEIKVSEDSRVMLYELTQNGKIRIRLGKRSIFSGNVNCDKIWVSAANGSIFQLTVNTEELTVNVARDCRARLAGTATSANINASDKSNVNALKMRAQLAMVTTTGSAKVRTNVFGKITADLDAESSLTCSGKKKQGHANDQTEASVVLVN